MLHIGQMKVFHIGQMSVADGTDECHNGTYESVTDGQMKVLQMGQ